MSSSDDYNSLIDDEQETLLRQVHPNQITDSGQPDRTAFTPSNQDGKLLSTLRERVGPAEAYQRHEALGRESAGTWGVNVGKAADAGLKCVDDEYRRGLPADHASVDFRDLEKKAIFQAARKLREASVANGRLFP